MAVGDGQVMTQGGPVPLLVGREPERSAIAELVGGLTEGVGGMLLVVGEAGIGKSALAEFAASAASAAGVRVVGGAGVPLTIGRPLQPVLDALEQERDPGAATVRTLLEATVGDPVTLLLQRTIDRLDAMTRVEPLLLVLEDLHWVDDATLTLLHHHLTRVDRRPLAVVATSRVPSPGTPLHHLLRAAGTARLELRGLACDEIETLLVERYGIDGRELDAEALATAAGNPLLVEAVVQGRRTGAPLADAGAPADEGAPELRGPIGAIVTSLTPEVLSLVQLAAVAGTELRIDLLAALSGLPIAVVLERLDRARVAGVVAATGDRLVFRHELYRSAVLSTLPTSARAALHLDIARQLEHLGASSLEIAEHVAQGARPGNAAAVASLVTAAEDLVDHDPSTALRISDVALGLLTRLDGPERLQVVRIAALAACGQSAEAELLGRALLRRGVPAATEARIRRDLALAAFVAGRPAESEAHMNRVVELTVDAEAAARARTELAWAQLLSLDRDGARDGASVGVHAGDAATRISAESLRCWLGLWSLDLAMAVTAADFVEAGVALRPAGDWQIFQPLLGAAAVRLETESFDRALDDATAGRRLAIGSGTAWAASAYDALAASVAFCRGELDLTTTLAAEALDATAIVDSFGVEIWSRALLARIALRRGDDAAARQHVEAARLASEDGRVQLGTDHLVLAEAALRRADGDLSAAETVLAEGWAFLTATGALYIRSAVGAEWVKLLAADPARADETAEVVAALEDDARTAPFPLVVAAAARARAWSDRSNAAVEGAVEAAFASQHLPHRLDVLSDAVELAHRHRSARTWAAEATALRTRLGCPEAEDRPVTRPAVRRTRPPFGPGSLTDAEVRVARLVAEGLTNARIASQLVVSRRTVDTQVLAVYRKLGVSSRVGLTRVLLDQPDA